MSIVLDNAVAIELIRSNAGQAVKMQVISYGNHLTAEGALRILAMQ